MGKRKPHSETQLISAYHGLTHLRLYDILRRTGLLASVYASSALSAPEPASTSNGGTLKSSTFAIQNLDDQVLQGGKNFSAGQKQLLCLARGLLKLKRSNFLILDESTANLDHNTDLIIQSAIREEIGMRQVTVLCIARKYLFVSSNVVRLHFQAAYSLRAHTREEHAAEISRQTTSSFSRYIYIRSPAKASCASTDRLQTIIDFDRVLVLSDGKIEEFDTPANLLSRGENGSQFARLCKETGDFARLKGSAEKGIGT